jgi:hypothetical protein
MPHQQESGALERLSDKPVIATAERCKRAEDLLYQATIYLLNRMPKDVSFEETQNTPEYTLVTRVREHFQSIPGNGNDIVSIPGP